MQPSAKRLIELRAPDIIIRNEKRMLQEACDALIRFRARGGTVILVSNGARWVIEDGVA